MEKLDLHSLLTVAGIASAANHPLALDVPFLLRDYASGRCRIDPMPVTAGPRDSGPQDIHPNDLQYVAHGSTIIAVQPIRGAIVSGISAAAEEWYGLFNLDRIHSTVATVAGNPAVSALVLLMDTPGGSVLGLRAAADALMSLPAQRPKMQVLTYTQRLAASAGMYLAAATQAIHAAPGAYIGSIGTVATLSDSTGFWAKLGVDRRVYTADSELKGIGMGPITDAHDEHMAATVQQYSTEFKTWMSDRRKLKPAAMQGQAWEARLAPKGMADTATIPTFEEFLAAMLGL